MSQEDLFDRAWFHLYGTMPPKEAFVPAPGMMQQPDPAAQGAPPGMPAGAPPGMAPGMPAGAPPGMPPGGAVDPAAAAAGGGGPPMPTPVSPDPTQDPMEQIRQMIRQEFATLQGQSGQAAGGGGQAAGGGGQAAGGGAGGGKGGGAAGKLDPEMVTNMARDLHRLKLNQLHMMNSLGLQPLDAEYNRDPESGLPVGAAGAGAGAGAAPASPPPPPPAGGGEAKQALAEDVGRAVGRPPAESSPPVDVDALLASWQAGWGV